MIGLAYASFPDLLPDCKVNEKYENRQIMENSGVRL